MKKNKDLQFCIDTLKSLQKRDESEPEPRRSLNGALQELKELRRKTNPAKAEIFRVVRRVAEAILNSLNGD